MRPYSYEEAYELCQKMIELRNAIRNGNHIDIQSYHDLNVFCRFADEGVMNHHLFNNLILRLPLTTVVEWRQYGIDIRKHNYGEELDEYPDWEKDQEPTFFFLKEPTEKQPDSGRIDVVVPAGTVHICKDFFGDKDLVRKITLPDGIESIGDEAFYCFRGLEKVNIPNTVVSIGKKAFRTCTSFRKISLPDKITVIEDDTFMHCTALNEISMPEHLFSIGRTAFESCTSLRMISIPGTVKNIGFGAFRDCYSLKNITLPEGLTRIEEELFYGCGCLEEIILPNSLIEIDAHAFSECKCLKNIVLPHNICKMSDDVFEGCTALESITANDYCINQLLRKVPFISTNLKLHPHIDDDMLYKDESGVIYRNDFKELVFCPKDINGNYIVREGTKTICQYAFEKCKDLKSVELPDTLENIEAFAFSECSSLANIALPSNLKHIGCAAFCKSGIKKIIIPKSVTRIDFYNTGIEDELSGYDTKEDSQSRIRHVGLFESCEALESVEIQAPITELHHSMFDDCQRLEILTIPGTVTNIQSAAFFRRNRLKKIVFNGTKIQWDSVKGKRYIPNDIEEITYIEADESSRKDIYQKYVNMITENGELIKVLKGNNGDEITVPDNISKLGGKCFYACSGFLKKVILPDNLEEISNDAFQSCYKLEEITIPDNVSVIGSKAFYNCSSLKTVKLPRKLKTIERSCFEECRSLVSVTLPDGVEAIGTETFKECISLTDIIIPEGVETLGEQAFYNCRSLSSVRLPKSLNKISDGVFDGCRSLERITANSQCIDFMLHGIDNIPMNVILQPYDDDEKYRLIGDMLYSADYTTLCFCPRFTKGTCSVSQNTYYIANNAFKHCENITEVVLPDGLKEIGDFSFSNCYKLTKMVLPDTLKKIGSAAFCYSGITDIIIPETVSVIDYYFVEVEPSLWDYWYSPDYEGQYIGLFEGCKSLECVKMLSPIKLIHGAMFRRCLKLKTLILPGSLEEVDAYAFDECESLSEITFMGTHEQWDSIEGMQGRIKNDVRVTFLK